MREEEARSEQSEEAALSQEGVEDVRDNTDPERDQRELEELRSLLLVEEKSEIEGLRTRLDERSLEAVDVAEVLADAVLLQDASENRFAKALSPTIDRAIQESVRNDPSAIADAIFPVIGPAIRKAIGQALAQTIEGLNTAMEHSFTPRGLGWRIEAWRSGRSFGEVVLAHNLVWRVEQIFLLHGETGVVLEEVGIPGGLGGDTDLVSGMLTAIQDFCADSFHTEERRPLHEISFDQFRVLVASGPSAAIAAVVRGRVPADFSERLDKAIEAIHARLAPDLNSFDGDTAKFVMARPLLEECLGEEARERKRSAASFLPVLLASGGVLLGAVYASRVVLREHSEKRAAEAAFAALNETPGIFVASFRKGTGADQAEWIVEGLLDPDAVDPEQILRRGGLDPEDVQLRWESIRSFEPLVLARRAERILDVPLGVRLSVEGEHLVARGVVPSEWLDEARARIELVDGVTGILVEKSEE